MGIVARQLKVLVLKLMDISHCRIQCHFWQGPWFAGGQAIASYWIYVTGPIIGAVIAARLYEHIRGGDEHAQGAPNELFTALETIQPRQSS